MGYTIDVDNLTAEETRRFFEVVAQSTENILCMNRKESMDCEKCIDSRICTKISDFAKYLIRKASKKELLNEVDNIVHDA